MDTRDAKTTLSPVSGSLHEGQQRGIFLDGKRELDTGSHDASKRLDLLPQDRLQVLHVAGADLEAVAEIARDGVALLDVEQGLDLFEKRTLETRVLEQHVHVRHEGYSDEARIEESREAPDESTRFQLLDPLVDRRRREPDRFRDSRLRDLRVSLENIEDPAIDVVHIKFGLEVRNPNFIWLRGPKQPGRHLKVNRRTGNLGSFRDHDDASLRDVEALAVFLLVEADLGVGRDLHAAVDDDPAQARVAPHVDAVHEHAFLDVGERVDPNAREQDRAVNRAARDDAARRDGRVGRDAYALGNRDREDELRGRLLRGVALQRPLVVVEVERRRDGDEVHRSIPG